jgi:hypothetical protein
MSKILLLVSLLCVGHISKAQVLQIQGGFSNSRFHWTISDGIDKITKFPMNGQSIFVGLIYLDKKYFNLSSNIGTFRRGGSVLITYEDSTSDGVAGAIDYFSINTMFEAKYPIKNNFVPFLSIGPRADIVISSKELFNHFKNGGLLNEFSYGLIVGAGLKYILRKVQLGIRADHLLSFNDVAELKDKPPLADWKITDKTFLVNATLGIKLK